MIDSAASSPDGLTMLFRKGIPDDLPYVYSSTLSALRADGSHVNGPAAEFFELHHRLLERILAQETLVVMHPMGEPHVILGYALVRAGRERTVLYSLYVKVGFRRMGLATRLLMFSFGAPLPEVIIHTLEVHSVPWRALKAKLGCFRFNPYLHFRE